MRLNCVISSILASVALYGQEATFRADTRLVVLNVSVFDKDGKMVRDLPKDAFTVYENGGKQTISVFRQEDVPISLGLIIDTSASMTDKRDRVASAALALVKASNPLDEVFIINFNESAVLAKDFTNNIQDLEKALRNLDAKGETAMRDAILLGIEHLRHRAHRDKKVLVVVTDGEDNSSGETQAHLIQAAQENDVIIYAVGPAGRRGAGQRGARQETARRIDGADWRARLVPERCGGDRQYRAADRARDSQSVCFGVHADEPGGGWELSKSSRGGEFSGGHRAHAGGILCAC